ncbi:MAG: HNH endonuclease, partial [Hydrogenophaga sp.]|nr:HNH endonuclease [Hydrogenophaga sp.]
MYPQVLQLDIQGTPQAWITPEQAALHYATEDVAWTIGDTPLITLRGGFNAHLGRQSMLEIAPIIALCGCARVNLHEVAPTVTRRKLFV